MGKKVYMILLSILLACLGIVFIFVGYSKQKEKEYNDFLKQEQIKKEQLVKEIKDSYNKYVKSDKETKLYYLDDFF